MKSCFVWYFNILIILGYHLVLVRSCTNLLTNPYDISFILWDNTRNTGVKWSCSYCFSPYVWSLFKVTNRNSALNVTLQSSNDVLIATEISTHRLSALNKFTSSGSFSADDYTQINSDGSISVKDDIAAGYLAILISNYFG